jgi:hypothetical protein
MDIAITLYRKDLEKAISDYLTLNGQSTEGKTLEIDYKAGRGVANISAIVVMSPENEPREVEEDEEEDEPVKVAVKQEPEKVVVEEDTPPFKPDTKEKIPGKLNPLFS